MPDRSSYAPGTPCWVDLGAADLEALDRLLLGAVRLGDPELPDSAEMGGYRAP